MCSKCLIGGANSYYPGAHFSNFRFTWFRSKHIECTLHRRFEYKEWEKEFIIEYLGTFQTSFKHNKLVFITLIYIFLSTNSIFPFFLHCNEWMKLNLLLKISAWLIFTLENYSINCISLHSKYRKSFQIIIVANGFQNRHIVDIMSSTVIA